MTSMNRRNCLKGTLAALTASAVPLTGDPAATTPMRSRGPNRSGIQLAELFYPEEQHKIRLASQIGITHAIVSVSPTLSVIPRSRYLEALSRIKSDFQAAGLIFAGVESHPVPAEKIKLGLPGRDEEIENYIAAIRALSQIDVRLLCYNWMAGIGWYRTRVDIPGRGGPC
jgi:mannonate dehydratase